MKFIFLLTLFILSVASYGGSTNIDVFAHKEDTLIWNIYIPGKSDMSKMQFEKEVAISWGFKMNYFFGDCTSQFDYKQAEFEVANEAVFTYLVNKFGEDWRTEFNHQVNTLYENSKK